MWVMKECVSSHRRSDVLTRMSVSLAICWGGCYVVQGGRVRKLQRFLVDTFAGYAQRDWSMSEGQVMRRYSTHCTLSETRYGNQPSRKVSNIVIAY